ncbi:MAG TPA: TIGR02270 family protein, partial [Nitrospirae bacterium]|nr:TIGR02270 family protein [Nitrospirota bacterium]
CRFWASWSACLLGDADAVSVLKSFSESPPHREEAVKIAMRRMDISSAHNWRKEFVQNPGAIRLALIGAGVIGDPVLIPWIIDQMTIPELARVAGESFTMITGIDIAYEDLEGEWPEGFEAGPTEEPEDEDVEMDPDEDLPWPEPQLVKDWWNKNKGRFKNGVRYLLGKSISPEHLRQVLGTGLQRQRAAAALELAIMQPGQPLFEIRTPGFRQKKILGMG